MVLTESSLGGGMETMVVSITSETLVNNGHEQLGEGRRNRYTSVVIHVGGITSALEEGCDLGIPPRLRSFLADGAVCQEVCQSLEVCLPYELQDLEWHGAST